MLSLTTLTISLILILIGAIIGSFISCLTYRIQQEDNFYMGGRSYCPQCKTILKWYDLIPLISYLLLKGRCRYCKSKISARYPIIELISATIIVLSFLKSGTINIYFFKNSILLYILLINSITDLESGYVYDIFTTYQIPAGFISNVLMFLPNFTNGILFSLKGTIACGVLIATIILLSKGGMGEGDLKIAMLMGAFLGLKLGLLSLYCGLMIGGVYAIFLLLTKKKKRKDALPLVPFLFAGSFVSIILYG